MSNAFAGFSPESFEQFARATSLCVFGPGVSAFGNGPDGGREAVFEGSVPYPYPPNSQWSGYGVIQAKCKEKFESTAKDQAWALSLLRTELQTFVSSARRLRKPEYYVFVTNVELSSASGGGRDQADALVRSFYGSLPFKGHSIWDANQLTGFVSIHERLRAGFVAFLTPGDVMSAMIAELESKRPNIKRILTSFLERELRADEASRLDQAGNRTEDQLRLAQLFFDVPCGEEPSLVAPTEQADEQGRLPPGILSELLHAGSRKLDPRTLYDQEIAADRSQGRFPTRFVILGGPGSGKSTVGQFLAQVHRAAILERLDNHLLEPRTRQIIRETHQLCERERFLWPATPRYVVRVELNRFAKALASTKADRVNSLATYLLQIIGGDDHLTHEEFLQWLATYPSLLILDGLDEVPATSNRDVLVQAVQNFLAAARQVGADVFIVATSRHQGYAGEFASGIVAFRHMVPLSTARALQYVERYADARFGATDPNRARDLVDKLRESAKRELTAQLMSSPLQVTFMATVVAARGDPGEDRWQLFDSYYRTIYDRERQKAVPPYDVVLSKQQPIIDRLHHDIGFLLQHQGEMVGDAASLPLSQFETLVATYLTEVGREGAEKEHLLGLITDAAQTRLVFLTSRVKGELSFDVRSLQEYMAAECLMTGDPKDVRERLRGIAPAPYWRNVFLFAASKCFADARSRHLQDSIRLLCEDLNGSGDPASTLVRVGSQVALDVLQSGAVSENPNHARHLARLALQLLARPSLTDRSKEEAPTEERLAAVYSDSVSAVYQDELELRTGQVEFRRALAAWRLLVQLISRDISWASTLGDKAWPIDHDQQCSLLERLLPDSYHVRWLAPKVANLVPHIAPERATVILNWQFQSEWCPSFLLALYDLVGPGHPGILEYPIVVFPKSRDLRLRAVPIAPGEEVVNQFAELQHMTAFHSGWHPFVVANQLFAQPSAATLSRLLKDIVKSGWNPEDKTFSADLPWPLAACLRQAKSRSQLSDIAADVEVGLLGDISDWRKAEERWKTDGLQVQDFVYQSKGAKPFDKSIAKIGFPDTGRTSIIHGPYSNDLVKALIALADQMGPASGRHEIMWLLYHAVDATGNLTECIEPLHLRSLLENVEPVLWWYRNPLKYPEQSEAIPAWLDFFDWLGRSKFLSPYFQLWRSGGNRHEDQWIDAWQRSFVSNPTRVGLLRMLSRSASSGYEIPDIPERLLQPKTFDDPQFRFAALLIRLTQKSLTRDNAIDIADAVAGILDLPAEPKATTLLFNTIEHHIEKVPGLEDFLVRLHDRMPAAVELGRAQCDRFLRQILRRKPSSLQIAGQLEKLRLPLIRSTP